MNPRITLRPPPRPPPAPPRPAYGRHDARLPAVLLALLDWIFSRPRRVVRPDRGAAAGVFPLIVMFLVTRSRPCASGRRAPSSGCSRCRSARPTSSRLRARVRPGGGRAGAVRQRPSRSGCSASTSPARCWPWCWWRSSSRSSAGHGPVRQRVRPHRVPGGAVHAGVRPAAAPAVRPVRPADAMPRRSRAVSDVLPLSYAVDALQAAGRDPAWLGDFRATCRGRLRSSSASLAWASATLAPHA